MNHEQAQHTIHQLFERGEIDEATHRCGLDALGETEPEHSKEALGCCSAEELEQWRRQDALHWQESLEDETFAERFEVGHGYAYGCIEQMLSCTDYDLLFALLSQVSQVEAA